MQENAARAVPGASEADRYSKPTSEISSPDSVAPSPLTAPQLVRLAASRRAQGDLPGAFEAYTRATAADPQLADELREEIDTLRSELARRAYAKGLVASRSDLGVAITLFEEALEFDPQHAGALIGLKRARAARR
jgi:tetratricopeptide (TPR) repeat protein